MSETYDAVYAAAQRALGHLNTSEIVEGCIRQFDISYLLNELKEEFLNVAYEQQRPSILMKPTLKRDGNQWCCMYGDDFAQGVVEFGDTPETAMRSFDEAMKKRL